MAEANESRLWRCETHRMGLVRAAATDETEGNGVAGTLFRSFFIVFPDP